MLEIFGEFYKVLVPLIDSFDKWVFPVIKTWWWVLPPFLLYKPAVFLWFWWRQELNFKDRKYLLLEIRLPAETLKPIKAMEDVFSTFYMIATDHDPGDFREKWIEGETTFYPALSLEIVSFGGETRFYIRTEDIYRDNLKSAIYSQYPNAEITETEDYTLRVPPDIPNEKWNLEGREFVLKKPDCYPIKTYEKFETGTESKEEKRVDPMAKLLEALSALKEGEQIWVQILLNSPEKDWKAEGEKIRDKLVKRRAPPSPKPILIEALDILIHGLKEEKEEEVKLLYPEMMLTPGEKEIVKEIEIKMSKSALGTTVRIIHLGEKEVFYKPHIGHPISFVMDFNTGHLNRFATISQTTTKVHSTLLWRMDKRRSFLRKRKMFRNYKLRLTPFFPMHGGTSILNLEELASMFHFPGRTVAPAPFVPRIEAKKGEAPSELPTE